jgi:hypothetical protein
MICYAVTQHDHRRVPCCSQSHLLSILDRHRLDRIAYHVIDGLQCTVYGPRAVGATPHPAATICVVFPRLTAGAAAKSDLFVRLFCWFMESGHQRSYPLLRSASSAVVCTPNGGTQRTAADLGRWCDEHTSALVRHCVLVNGDRA